jgi:hypothetical protein
MKNEVVCQENEILKIVPIQRLSYSKALRLAFDKISQKNVISSWKDSLYQHSINKHFFNNIQVPEYGVYTDQRTITFDRPAEEVIDNIWSIGGNRGWYFGNWLWRIRGVMDKLVGGVGLRRGRRSETDLKPGDALDFWRVLVADRSNGRLLLYAEMKLPGEAWLEFKIKHTDNSRSLIQTATFRPLGLWGRLYWYFVLPFHGIIFPKMAKNLVNAEVSEVLK